MASSFMAKYDEREGNSCHIHISLRDGDGGNVFAGDGQHGFSPLFAHFLAGQLACLRELTYLFAPNVNSYKRFAEGSFAPTAVAWGMDNRTCSLRVVGHGAGLRVENRVPGGDVNPYLGGGRAHRGRAARHRARAAAAAASSPATPTSPTRRACRRPCARRPSCSPRPRWRREAFGDDVVDHYANAARVELAAFDAAVTDWERRRGFERL